MDIFKKLFWSEKDNESFFIGTDNFSDLVIQDTSKKADFYYFMGPRGLVKYFVLNDSQMVRYVASIVLIKKGERLSPRVTFAVQDKTNKRFDEIEELDDTRVLKSKVSLDNCHENFWKLVGYLQSLVELDIPKETFSLIETEEIEIVNKAKKLSPEGLAKLLEEAAESNRLKLSKKEINLILGRKKALEKFTSGLKGSYSESKWQKFFEKNTWIFGYGLNYVFLSSVQNQPNYGGADVTGKGGQRGDYLTASMGDVRFTTLVEIKKPDTPLLAGSEPIRNGAWSFSKDLTDAISQLQTNKRTWETEGAKTERNMDLLEKEGVFSISPRGILVIGKLDELNDRDKRNSFELFRQSLSAIEILTFDELYERAKFIVENENNQS